MDQSMDQAGDKVSEDSIKAVMEYLFDINKNDARNKLQMALKDKEIEDLKKQNSVLSDLSAGFVDANRAHLISAPFSTEEFKKNLTKFLHETMEYYLSNIDAAKRSDMMECKETIEMLTEQISQMQNDINELKEQIQQPTIPHFTQPRILTDYGNYYEETESEEECYEEPENRPQSVYLSASPQCIEESGNQSGEDNFIDGQILDGPPQIFQPSVDYYGSQGNNQENERQQLNDQAYNDFEIEISNATQQNMPNKITHDISFKTEPIEKCLSESFPKKRHRHSECLYKAKKVVLPKLWPKEEPEDGIVEKPLEMDPNEQSTSGSSQNNQTDGTCDSQTVSVNQSSSTQMSYEPKNYSMNFLQNRQLFSGNLCSSSNQFSSGQALYTTNPPTTSIPVIGPPPPYWVNMNADAQAGQLPFPYNPDSHQH